MSIEDEQSFQEIRDQFLKGKYEYDTIEYAELGSLLHIKMDCIRDILPLLESNSHSCEYLGLYIAVLEGERACPIFTTIYMLAGSPWMRIRDQVCDCIVNCGTTCEEFERLFSMLDDPEEAIRVKIINMLMFLEPRKLETIESALVNSSIDEDFKFGFSTIASRGYDEMQYQEMIDGMSSHKRMVRIFSYVTCYLKHGRGEELDTLIGCSSDPDLKRHYEIYFTES